MNVIDDLSIGEIALIDGCVYELESKTPSLATFKHEDDIDEDHCSPKCSGRRTFTREEMETFHY